MGPLFKTSRHIHFVGIGGVGMSGIAEVLLHLGHKISGSDSTESEVTRRLARLGAQVTYGHRSDSVHAGIDVVVISSAVKYSNPEIVQARALKIPVIPRAEMLAELMRMKWGIAVAGTHGKTTTTSLIATILGRAGLDPTVVIGGKLHALGSNAQLGRGDLMVAEADESDGTFLLLSPTIAVVTNIDPEHLDYYGDMDRVRSAYLEFMNRVPFFGAAVLCLDDVTMRALLPQVRKRVITYGTTPDADFVARNLCVCGMETHFEVERGGTLLGDLTVRLPGRHHALNALAALAVATELDVPFDTVRALWRSSAAFTVASRCAARRGDHGGQRLRPPSGGDPRHPGGGARGLRSPHRRPLPAASVHTHARPVRRLPRCVRCGGSAVPDRHLSGRRGTDRGGHR